MEDRHTLLTAREAAGQLGISTRDLYRLIDSTDLPAYKMGRDLRLRQADVDDYLRDHPRS